jgi:hypothetical protein
MKALSVLSAITLTVTKPSTVPDWDQKFFCGAPTSISEIEVSELDRRRSKGRYKNAFGGGRTARQ